MDPGNAGYLLSNYVAIVGPAPAVCTFIGTSIIGAASLGLAALYERLDVYVLSLVGVSVAYIIDFLAGTFGARKNFTTP